jgi:dTDP-4-amino-4,6-dideoxygalactose transaminase
LGAFDPIDKIADLCEKYNLWLHVDAAWGGGALMSQKYKKLLKGIERYGNMKQLVIHYRFISTRQGRHY